MTSLSPQIERGRREPAPLLTELRQKPAPAAAVSVAALLLVAWAALLLGATVAQAADSVAPPAAGGSAQVSVKGDAAVLRYSSGSTFTQYTWQCPTKLAAGPTMSGVFGPINFQTNAGGKDSGPVDIKAYGSIDWIKPMTFVRATQSGNATSASCRLQFTPDTNMVITASLAGPALQFDVSVDQKVVKRLIFPLFNPGGQQPVRVPYIDAVFLYFPGQNVFATQYLDWIHTNATNQTGMSSIYGALTNGTYNLLKDRGYLAVSGQLDSLFPTLPNPPSPFMSQVAGRVVIDFWGGTFQGLSNRVQDLAAKGVLNGIVIIHDWTFAGNGLDKMPQHRPANPNEGGDAELNKTIQQMFKAGHLVALHEDYVDYYPDYPKFNAADVALDSDGSKQKGWYNEAVKTQSFWTKPTVMLKEAKEDGIATYQEFKTNAAYIDVNSSFSPGKQDDMDASQPGAGMQSTFAQYTIKLWQLERDIHHGPVFGEGSSHWYWSGYLDGVEAQFGAGFPAAQATKAPMLVDFDLLRIHPLQVNHGMGYYARWSPNLAKGNFGNDSEVDLYRVQEVSFGHAPFIDKVISTNATDLYAVNEYSLVTPVSKRYGTAKVTSIKYYNKGQWVDTSTAYKQGTPGSQFDTVLVTYDNGLQVLGNAGQPLQWGGYDIPQNGWVAKGNGVEAGTVRKNGSLVDFVESPEEVYAHVRAGSLLDELKNASQQNARPAVDFASVRTNGMNLLTHDQQGWVLYALPQGPGTTLAVKTARIPAPAQVQCRSGATGSAKTQPQGDAWSFQPIANCTSYKW